MSNAVEQFADGFAYSNSSLDEEDTTKAVAAETGAKWRNAPALLRSSQNEWIKSLSERRNPILAWTHHFGAHRQIRPIGADSLQTAINSSRWILDLEDDWDEQGAIKYSRETWDDVCKFLIRQTNAARKALDRELPIPRVLPGPGGSIDVHWKTARFELLVNFPADKKKAATFYGDNYGILSIRGNFSLSEDVLPLVAWLL